MPTPVTLLSCTRVVDPDKLSDSSVTETATRKHRGRGISLGKSKKLRKLMSKVVKKVIVRGAALLVRLKGKSKTTHGVIRRTVHVPTPKAVSVNKPRRNPTMPSGREASVATAPMRVSVASTNAPRNPPVPMQAEEHIAPQSVSRRESIASESAVLPHAGAESQDDSAAPEAGIASEASNAPRQTIPSMRQFGNRNRFREGTVYQQTMGRLNATPPRFQHLSTAFLDFARSTHGNVAPIEHLGMVAVGSIDKVVADWYPTEQYAEIIGLWRGLMEEDVPGISAFAAHLAKLGAVQLNGAALMHTESVRTYVQTWLTQVAQSTDLLMQTAALSLEAFGICDDRMLFIFTQMQEPRIYDDVQRGKFDLPGLVEAGRGHFRNAKLGEIADEIVKKQLDGRIELAAKSSGGIANMTEKEVNAQRLALLERSEQLEAFVRLLAGNKTSLHLEIPYDSMCYAPLAGVGNEEVAAAGERVKVLENSDYAYWLSNWAPWIALMEKQHPAEYKEMQARKNEIAEPLMEKLSAEIPAEIERMKEAGELPNDKSFQAVMAQNNAEIRLGAEKWRLSGVEAVAVAMQEMANKMGHAGIMDPRWPSAQ